PHRLTNPTPAAPSALSLHDALPIFIIRDPRKEADAARGSVVEHFTENVDIMPTMLDLIGAQIPVQCDGTSLRTFLEGRMPATWRDRKSTRLNSSHVKISYAVFCLKK